jgi:hypothetical protein
MTKQLPKPEDPCFFSKLLRENVDFERKKRLTKFVCIGEDVSSFEQSAVISDDKLLDAIPVASKRIVVPKEVSFQKYPAKEWDRAVRIY